MGVKLVNPNPLTQFAEWVLNEILKANNKTLTEQKTYFRGSKYILNEILDCKIEGHRIHQLGSSADFV